MAPGAPGTPPSGPPTPGPGAGEVSAGPVEGGRVQPEIAMIRRMTWIERHCECGALAVMEVERTNDELPEGYVQWGTRTLAYCREHLPDDVRAAWRLEESDPGPIVKPRDLG